MSSPPLKPHSVTTRPHMGGHLQVYCSGCGYSTTRTNEAGAKLVADRHSALNAQQFKGYQTPARGADGESSN